MSESIFRKKNIEQVSSPEQLNEYIHVASPGIWLVLAAIIVFLVGIIVWSVFAVAETKIPAAVVCTQGNIICFVRAGGADLPKAGMKVTVGEKTGTIKSVSANTVRIDGNTQEHLLYVGGFEAGEYCYTAQVELEGISDGFYSAEITAGSINPISFVLQ